MRAAIRKPAHRVLSSLSAPAKSMLRTKVHRATLWVGIVWNRLEARLYDLRFGTDTTGSTPATGLDIPKAAEEHVTGFQSVNERHLRRVLESLPLPQNSVFVDIGCGKGKALLIAAEYGFVDRAIGVELAGSLCRAADANVLRTGSKSRARAPIDIFHADATTFVYTRIPQVARDFRLRLMPQIVYIPTR